MEAFVIHVERDRNINDAVAKVELVGFNSIITKPIFNNSDCSYCYRWTQNISGSWSKSGNDDANDDGGNYGDGEDDDDDDGDEKEDKSNRPEEYIREEERMGWWGW